jgi:oxygen-independent coproporphyrinogen III oxidase
MEALEVKQPPYREDGAYVFHHPPKFLWDSVPEDARSWGAYHVYLHVPFCRQICTFCTFERKQLRKGALPGFLASLATELGIVQGRDDLQRAHIESVYLGGGTASLLPNQAIVDFLQRLREGFGLSETAECTLECEPGTKKECDFRFLIESGVNRVSIGVQSFSDALLRHLNRRHTVDHSVRMAIDARRAGVQNIHLDLMYGLPGQHAGDWETSIARSLELGVDHISVYPLIIFPHETLARALHQEDLPPVPCGAEINAMRIYAHEALTRAGYSQYSLTEYAQPGKECRYVKATWDGSDYLGFGPGAYSRNRMAVWENTVLHWQYDEMLIQGRKPIGKGTTMTPRVCMARDIAMGLCLLSVDLARVEARSGVSVEAEFGSTIEALVAEGLLSREGSILSLTSQGIRYATHVMKAFTEG